MDAYVVLRRQSFIVISSVLIYLSTFLFFGFLIVSVWVAGWVAWSLFKISRILVSQKAPSMCVEVGVSHSFAIAVAIILSVLYFPILYFNWQLTDGVKVGFVVDKPLYSDLPGYADPLDYRVERDSFLAELAEKVYEREVDLPLGHWAVVAYAENPTSGFEARAYRFRNGEVVLAFRGTEPSARDILSDVGMLLGVQPQQFRDGQEFFSKLSVRYDVKYVVGHSLGGSIAQYVAARNMVDGLTINAFGAVPVTESEYLDSWMRARDPGSVLNLRSTSDVVSDAHFQYTLWKILSNGVGFVQGRFVNHIGCVTSLQYGGYAEHQVRFPASVFQAHKSAEFVNILRTNDIVDSGEYQCGGPQDRIGLLFGFSPLRGKRVGLTD